MLPKQREPDIQFDDYEQTDMSRSIKWHWFLSSSGMDSDDHEEHREMDYLELCHQKERSWSRNYWKRPCCVDEFRR